MYGAVAGHCCRAVRKREVKIQPRNFGGVVRIVETQLFRKGIAVQPVDEPFSPAGNNRCLRKMDVRVDEPGGDQRIAVIRDRRFGMSGA